jgi:hypothetical protein
MSIQDGWSILKGNYKSAGNRSATIYFKDKTEAELFRLFRPKIHTSLGKPLIGTTSANQLWDKFVNAYNVIVKSPANILMKLEPVEEPDLASYVTRNALDGLFAKVGDEEKKIRANPYNYASDLIEKVFGSVKES